MTNKVSSIKKKKLENELLNEKPEYWGVPSYSNYLQNRVKYINKDFS